jgi:uncharacterized protein
MGLTYSKTIRFGGVRFNLSGSGIGVSVGIPGMRIGTGPRGAYISGGAGGFRYRRSLGGSSGRRAAARTAMPAPASPPTFEELQRALEAPGQQRFDTADALTLDESDGEGLVAAIREQRGKLQYWPFVASMGIISFLLAPDSVRIAVLITFASLSAFAAWRDRLRRLTVLFYDLDAPLGATFEAMARATTLVAASSSLKAVALSQATGDTKRNAGATHAVSTVDATATLGHPAGIVANVSFPMLKSGRTTLVFLPDQVLLVQGKELGSVSYAAFRARSTPSKFVSESPAAPHDATVIGSTWRYVNRDGGPDRRFNDNAQLPVCRYSELEVTTDRGLSLRFLSSRDGVFEAFVTAIQTLTHPARTTTTFASAHIAATRPTESPAHAPESPRPAPSAEPGSPHAAGVPADSFIRRHSSVTIAVATLILALAWSVHVINGAPTGPAETSSAPMPAAEALPTNAPATHPSFDCTKTKALADHLICSSDALSARDAALAQRLIDLKQRAGSLRRALTTDSIAAWKDRQTRCRTEACIEDWFGQREDAMQQWEIRIAEAAVAASNATAANTPALPDAASTSRPEPSTLAASSAGARTMIVAATTPFSCNDIRTEAHRLICSDDELRSRQTELQRLTDDARRRLPANRLEAFIVEGAQAMVERDACADRACVLAWMDRRATALRAW